MLNAGCAIANPIAALFLSLCYVSSGNADVSSSPNFCKAIDQGTNFSTHIAGMAAVAGLRSLERKQITATSAFSKRGVSVSAVYTPTKPTARSHPLNMARSFVEPTQPINNLDEVMRRFERDEFDLVALGRALLLDPAWVLKASTDAPFEPFNLGAYGSLD